MTGRPLPNNWASAPLDHLCSKISDGSHNPPDKQPAGIPMLSARNIVDNQINFDELRYITDEDFEVENKRTNIAASDVLLTIVGTIGRSAVVKKEHGTFCLQRSVAVLKPVELNSKYICFALQEPTFQRQLNANAKGTAQKGIYLRELKALKINVAPRAEQDRIVSKLEELFSDLDAGIETMKFAQQQLKVYRQSVLNCAFLGRLTENWRESANAKPKQNESEPHELSEPLPAGWNWMCLGDLIAEGPQNGLYKPQDKYGSGLPILRIDDFQDDWSRSSTELRLVDVTSEEATVYGLREGDLVINRVNSLSHLGKAVLIEKRNLPALFESNMMRLVLSPSISGRYIQLYLQNPAGRKRLVSNAKHAVNQASINQKDVASTIIPVAPLKEQQIIVMELEARLAVCRSLEQTLEIELERSRAIRQSILTKAFEGRLVPQDPNDEPAQELLTRIAAERLKEPIRAKPGAKEPQTRKKSHQMIEA